MEYHGLVVATCCLFTRAVAIGSFSVCAVARGLIADLR
jgi:hypothetical protein